MGTLTTFIAIFGSLAALFSTPRRALIIYLSVMFLYPQHLTLNIGSISFTTSRILILVVLTNIFFRTPFASQLKWNWLDFFVMAAFLGKCIALVATTDALRLIERQGGLLIDTVFPYFATRLIVTSRKDLISIIKSLTFIAIPLAIIGVYESVTGQNLYSFLQSNDAWMSYEQELRHGFYRAVGPVGIPINFGLVFAVVFPICLGLRYYPKIRKKWVLSGCAFTIVGVLSSMSSAPFFSTAVSVAAIFFYPLRKHWRVFLVLFLTCCLAVELFSSRHFYQIFDRLALNPKTARYRIGLVEEALGGGMKDHWLTGYGLVGIGKTEESTHSDFNWEHDDFVNIYIGILACYGLLGLLPYFGLNILYYRRLHQAFARATFLPDRWLIWCFLSSMVGWNVAMLTVGAFGVNTLLHILIANIGNLPQIVSQDFTTLPDE